MRTRGIGRYVRGSGTRDRLMGSRSPVSLAMRSMMRMATANHCSFFSGDFEALEIFREY